MRLKPNPSARIVWLSSPKVASCVVAALLATKRYRVAIVPFFSCGKCAVSTDAPKKIIQILGGGRAFGRKAR